MRAPDNFTDSAVIFTGHFGTFASSWDEKKKELSRTVEFSIRTGMSASSAWSPQRITSEGRSYESSSVSREMAASTGALAQRDRRGLRGANQAQFIADAGISLKNGTICSILIWEVARFRKAKSSLEPLIRRALDAIRSADGCWCRGNSGGWPRFGRPVGPERDADGNLQRGLHVSRFLCGNSQPGHRSVSPRGAGADQCSRRWNDLRDHDQ